MQNPELFWGDMSTIIDFEGVNIEKITHFESILSDFQKSLKLHYCEFDVKNHSKSIILKDSPKKNHSFWIDFEWFSRITQTSLLWIWRQKSLEIDYFEGVHLGKSLILDRFWVIFKNQSDFITVNLRV